MSLFQKATKTDLLLRMAITGPSNAGKTYSSLMIGKGLDVGRMLVIDTENGSASKYADQFDFDTVILNAKTPGIPYKDLINHPENFMYVLKEAAKAGYKLVILDSYSHAWEGPGGCLELHDIEESKQKTKNSYTAWSTVTKLHNMLREKLLSYPGHVIVTMRSAMEYVQEGNKVRKIGMQPNQRKGMEYEFDVVLDMDADHKAIVSKTRCHQIADRVYDRCGGDLVQLLREWLGNVEQAITTNNEKLFEAAQKTSQQDQAQRELDEELCTFEEFIKTMTVPADANQMLKKAKSFPEHEHKRLNGKIGARAKELGIEYNAAQKQCEFKRADEYRAAKAAGIPLGVEVSDYDPTWTADQLADNITALQTLIEQAQHINAAAAKVNAKGE